MKKSTFSICLAVLVTLSYSSHAQQNRTVSDTSGLHNEYTSLGTNIADLNTQLNIAKSNLAAYHSSKVETAKTGNEAAASAGQVSKTATGKKVPAVENLKKDYENASQADNRRLNGLHDRIFILSAEINKKNQRLQQLSASEIL